MKRPLSLTIGVVLQWVAAAVGLVAGLDLVAAAFEMSKQGVAEQLEATLRELGISDIAGSLLLVGVFLAGVLVLVLNLLRVVVSAYLLQGRAWARMVITVLIAISIVGGIAYLFEGYVMRMLLVVPIDIVMLWLIFNSDSSAYIKDRSAARTAERTVDA